jgi:CubicO group peptidase (beta-lactamase class C family)
MRTLIGAAVSAPAHAASDLTVHLDGVIAPHFPANEPGAAVLVKKGDRILLRKAYGLADVELGVPMRPELIFRLGSITKQFTAAAIMMLADEGELSLHDDVRKYVPEYPAHGAKVTLEHLLTHTSGVPSYTAQEAFHKRVSEDLTCAELLATFKDLPLEFSPSEQWRYSNSGYYLLGLVIEKASGKSYAEFVGERIFGPLGMADTGYADADKSIPSHVVGYDRAGDRFVNAEPWSMKAPFAAGGLVSSVDDLARWDRAICDGKLLKKESWARIFTAAKLKDGSSTGYGFGWSLGAWQGHRIASHSGGIPGFSTAITRMPEDRVVVVVLCNSFGGPTQTRELALKLAALAIDKPVVDPNRVKVDGAVLDRYVGVYKIDDKQRVVVRRDGDHLTLQRSSGDLLTLTAESDTQFFVRDTALRFAFQRDGSGHVREYEVTQPDGSVAHRRRTDAPLPVQPTVVSVDAKILDGYVGEYELAPGFILAITREGGQLYAQLTGQPRLEIFASAQTEFFLRAVDAQLTFHADALGRVASLVLHQAGRDVSAKRMSGDVVRTL